MATQSIWGATDRGPVVGTYRIPVDTSSSSTPGYVTATELQTFIGAGTVTTVSVASANGFAGTVANATTTPAITLTTSITGVLKGNGTAISAATAGTDYQIPISLTTTGTSGAATFNTGTGALNIPQYTGGGGGSGITRSVNSISTATNAGATAITDYVYLVSGTTTLTLPTAVGNTNLYTVKNVGNATITVASTSGTFDGAATITMATKYSSLDFISDGTNWNVV